MFLKISQNSQLQLYQKETPTQVFPCEFYEIFKNSCFTEHLATTSGISLFMPNFVTLAGKTDKCLHNTVITKYIFVRSPWFLIHHFVMGVNDYVLSRSVKFFNTMLPRNNDSFWVTSFTRFSCCHILFTNNFRNCFTDKSYKFASVKSLPILLLLFI